MRQAVFTDSTPLSCSCECPRGPSLHTHMGEFSRCSLWLFCDYTNAFVSGFVNLIRIWFLKLLTGGICLTLFHDYSYRRRCFLRELHLDPLTLKFDPQYNVALRILLLPPDPRNAETAMVHTYRVLLLLLPSIEVHSTNQIYLRYLILEHVTSVPRYLGLVIIKRTLCDHDHIHSDIRPTHKISPTSRHVYTIPIIVALRTQC